MGEMNDEYQNFQQFSWLKKTKNDCIQIRSNIIGLNILKGYQWSDHMIENIRHIIHLKSKVNMQDINFIAIYSHMWCQCQRTEFEKLLKLN